MQMKISWGIKITVLYLGFVALTISLVTMSIREKVDLVSKDYYEQELQFQDKIDRTTRSGELKEPLTWEVKKNELMLKFPAQFIGQKITGSIYFFRPSDASLDKTISIPADASSIKNISTHELKAGLYKMQINWEVNDVEYYNEGIIQVN
jgi:hypothetical protein